MAPSPEDRIVQLKIQLQDLEREKNALNARIAAKRAELYEAKQAQQAAAASLSPQASPPPQRRGARKSAPSHPRIPSSGSASRVMSSGPWISRRASRSTASSRARMTAPSLPSRGMAENVRQGGQ